MTVYEAFLEQDLLDLQNKVNEKDRRIAELKAQIDKMKCCGNCGKWENCEKDEMFSQDICGDWELWEE